MTAWEQISGKACALNSGEKHMIRNANEADHAYVISRLNNWWGGRNMSSLLPRLFFQHFNDSSFVYEENGKLVGFLIGFKSQSLANTGYVHFIGVDPEHRLNRVASQLYEAFFEYCRKNRIELVKCITSPVNKASIAFHQRIGFRAATYDVHGNPIPVENYESAGEARMVFRKVIST